MRRDSIFYKIFQQSPAILFSLISDPPANADAYCFDSVSIKETRFEIDGIFLPPDSTKGTVFFCEVQFQKDSKLYERIFAETSLYFYRNCERFSDWQTVVIYPSRNIEQSNLHPHRSLLNGDQVERIYLDEIGDIRQLPIWAGLMLLTTVKESEAPDDARYLLERATQETTAPENRAIIDMVFTIISYRFDQLNSKEI
ncbi:MAG: Rpn family recombination-promoting nuclease/putative transposase, partial [Cyanobacteria bacterium J06573_11]